MCFELQLMVPDFIIIIIGLYLAFDGNHTLDGLLQKKGEDLVIAMNSLFNSKLPDS